MFSGGWSKLTALKCSFDFQSCCNPQVEKYLFKEFKERSSYFSLMSNITSFVFLKISNYCLWWQQEQATDRKICFLLILFTLFWLNLVHVVLLKQNNLKPQWPSKICFLITTMHSNEEGMGFLFFFFVLSCTSAAETFL